MRNAVTGGLVLVNSRGQQYCPELRIPLNHSTGLAGRMPVEPRAAVPDTSGRPAAGLAIFAYSVFMVVFLFTFVNTKYGRSGFI